MVQDSIVGSIKEISIAWIAGRQIDFGSVTMSFIDMTDSSIRLQVNNRLIQVIVPPSFQLEGCASSSTSSSGEVFLVTSVGYTSDELFENMLMTLNEKLERVAVQPDSLSQVFDYLLLALQKYQKLKKGVKGEAANSNLVERTHAHSDNACDSDDDGLLSGVDDCDLDVEAEDNSPDHYGYDIATCENVGSTEHIEYTTSGFLYVMAESARLQCELAREMANKQELLSDDFEHRNSLQWCHVILDPKLFTVNLLIHVGGIVCADSLASAVGISVNSPVKISLPFGKSLWMQREKAPLKPFNEGCIVTQEMSTNDLAEESSEQTHNVSYGNGVLLPKLVRAFFQFLLNDTVTLEEKPKSREFYDELHQFTSMENTFVGLLCFLCARIKALQDWCVVCLNSLPYSVCRLRSCDRELCLFTFEELGVGTPVLQEVQTFPEIFDFEISLAIVAAGSGRDVFEPFPTFLLQKEQLRGRSGWFSKAQRVESANTAQMAAQLSSVQVCPAQNTTNFSSNKNMKVLKEVLASIPPVEVMQKCRDEATLRNTLNTVWVKKLATGKQSSVDERLEEQASPSWGKSLPYSVLRYVLSTNRLKLHLLEGSERFPFFNSLYQFVVLHDSPEREAYFESRRLQEGGSFFAFHGSSADNWYSILRNGLRCLSNTSFMSAGASYGSGIYFGSILDVSLRFCTSRGSGWGHGLLKDGFAVLAICEIINGSIRSEQEMSAPYFSTMSHRGIMVVPPEYEKDVAMRYIIVLGGQNVVGQVSINGTRMPDNSDLMEHYLALRSSYGAQQEEQRKIRSVECLQHMSDLCRQSKERVEEHKDIIRVIATNTEKKIEQSGIKSSCQNPSVATVSKKPAASAGAAATAMQAIAREYKNIIKQTKEAEGKYNATGDDFPVLAGIEVNLPDDTNICRWHVNLSQLLFKNFPLYRDLVECAHQWNVAEVSVKLECTFPETYPFSPPFVRVISPKFSFHTGHVTVGGSICMELLTGSGWSPAYTFESVIVQVVNAMIEGGGRLDKRAIPTRSEYSELEAREAFERVARDHGWN